MRFARALSVVPKVRFVKLVTVEDPKSMVRVLKVVDEMSPQVRLYVSQSNEPFVTVITE